jgi:hypothetical protein
VPFYLIYKSSPRYQKEPFRFPSDPSQPSKAKREYPGTESTFAMIVSGHEASRKNIVVGADFGNFSWQLPAKGVKPLLSGDLFQKNVKKHKLKQFA